MLLSFSVPEMLPMIRAGLAQRAGLSIDPGARVKRQTIRRRGPRAERMLAQSAQQGCQGWHYAQLHLWWKSRTRERELLGCIESGGYRIYPITILHSTVEYPGGPTYPILRISGPRGWRSGDSVLFWSEQESGRCPAFKREVQLDGFDSVAAFRDFFVPKVGDRFDAILFKW